MILSGSGGDSGDGGFTIPDSRVFIIETGAIDFTGTDFIEFDRDLTGLGIEFDRDLEGIISSNSSTMDSFSDSGT